MSLELIRRAELTAQQVAELERAMAAFYRNPLAAYYQTANEAWDQCSPKDTPFHFDLASRVTPGASVLELGCGTARLCPHVESRGGLYTGVDYNERVLEENRWRFPKARFHPMGTPLAETFDVVASLYTIEHVVDPPAYLEQMWRHCRPGGFLGIICPEFVEGPHFPPSVFYGRTPRRLREKVRALSLVDASLHLLDLKVRRTRWKKRARQTPPGAFWINLRPRVLCGGEYGIDADAVHLVRRRDLVWYWEQKGASILQTSAEMPGILPEPLRYNCYVLARKPERASSASLAPTVSALRQ